MSNQLHRSPAFQFYADDFLAGTLDLSQEEVGAYIRLLCHQWNRGSIPVETEKQQRLAGGSVSVDVLAKFRLVDGLGLVNERLETERAKQAAYRQKQSEKGLASAEARKKQPRFNHGSTTVGTAVQPSGQPEGQPEGNSPVSSLQSSTNNTKERDRWELEFGLSVPEQLRTENCLTSLKTWLAYKKERREGYKRIGLQAMLTKLASEYTPADLPKAIEASIAAGWKGIYTGLNFGKPIPTESKGDLLRKIQANRGFPNHPDHANATAEEKALHATMSAKYKAME